VLTQEKGHLLYTMCSKHQPPKRLAVSGRLM